MKQDYGNVIYRGMALLHLQNCFDTMDYTSPLKKHKGDLDRIWR